MASTRGRFRVLSHVPTADPVTHTPIDPRFTGSDIRTIVAAFASKAEAEAERDRLAANKPVYVSQFSVSEAAF